MKTAAVIGANSMLGVQLTSALALIAPDKAPFRLIHFPDSAHTFRLLGKSPTVSIAEGITRIRDQKTWPAFGPLDVT